MIAHVFTGSCDETREHLSEHLEGELRGWRRFRVFMHLRRCERCREALRSLARAVDQLRSLGRAEAAPSVVESVLDRIRRLNGGGR